MVAGSIPAESIGWSRFEADLPFLLGENSFRAFFRSMQGVRSFFFVRSNERTPFCRALWIQAMERELMELC